MNKTPKEGFTGDAHEPSLFKRPKPPYRRCAYGFCEEAFLDIKFDAICPHCKTRGAELLFHPGFYD